MKITTQVGEILDAYIEKVFEGSFKNSGTMVSTRIVMIEKP